MKRLLSILLSLGFLIPLTASAACSPVALGGTGNCYFVANALLLGNGTSPIATTTAGINGQFLSLVAGVPTWATVSSGSGNVSTSTGETAGYLAYWTSTNGTPALLGKVATSSAATASTIVARDGSGNAYFNNYLANGTLTTSAGGTTVLTVASSRFQALTGSSAQTYQLPDATTLSLGPWFVFNNNSSQSLTVTNNGGSTIYTVPAGGITQCGPTSIATANGTWDCHSYVPSNATWGTGTTGLIFNTALNTTPQILSGASSPTSPTFIPQRVANTTGFGGDGTKLYATIAGSPILFVSASGASTTALSVFGRAYFGGTATSSFDSAGVLSLATPLSVANGGTGAATLTGCLTGNGTGAITGSGTCNTSNASVSSVATNNGVTGGTITTTGTISLDTSYGAIWTPASTTYTQHLSLNNASSSLFTNTGNMWLTALGTAAGAFLAVDPNGKIIATTSPSASTAPAGSGTQIQYNDFGIFGASSAFTWATSTNTLTLNGGGSGDAQTTYGPSSFQWALGYKSSDNSFRISSSTALGTSDGLIIDKNLKTTLVNASTTGLSASGIFYSPITSAVLVADSANKTIAATTQTCTNQFMRALSAAYSATCATVSLTADVTGILPIANGGTNASSFTLSNGLLAYDGTRAVNYTGYTLTSSLLTATNASTTAFSVNSTNIVGDGAATSYMSPTRAISISYATTTTWTASTTLLDIGVLPFGMTVNTARCHTDAGTLNVQFQYSTGPTFIKMLTASSTIGAQAITTSNTPAKGDDIAVKFGTPASSPTSVTCTLSGPQTGV